MFTSLFLKSFRILLLPFSIFYWLGITVRNFLYDKKILKSAQFALPMICVGNLAVGGTGKTPMVEYLISLFWTKKKLATLSRGYKRKTRGYVLARSGSTALDIGDEPMQFFLKFPGITVAVGEDRLDAIPQLLYDRPETELIILDDAFQHRAVTAGLNILMTEYSNLYTRDFYLPTGDLRDLKSSYKRAHIIIISKCDDSITDATKDAIIKELKPLPHQQVFFTTLEYGLPYHISNNTTIDPDAQAEMLLVTGIANPRPLQVLLENRHASYQMLQYPDHHVFSIDDWSEIKKRFSEIKNEKKLILTTEKDAVRLHKFLNEMNTLPLYVQPVQHRFLFGSAQKFDELIIKFTEDFKK